MKLYFLRHGESVANFEERYTGQLDVALTDKGRAQAVLAGKAIFESGLSFDKIVSSPLDRARETATIVARLIGYDETAIIDEPLVMERHFGDLQGKTKAETGSLTGEQIENSGAETDQDLRNRAKEFLAKIRQDDAQKILVVSHNGFGQRLRSVLHGTDPEDAWRTPKFPNAELVELGEV
jgi:broad specificity phosphatase PhoE